MSGIESSKNLQLIKQWKHVLQNELKACQLSRDYYASRNKFCSILSTATGVVAGGGYLGNSNPSSFVFPWYVSWIFGAICFSGAFAEGVNYLFEYGKKASLFHECCSHYAKEIRQIDSFLATWTPESDLSCSVLQSFTTELNVNMEKLEMDCGPYPESVTLELASDFLTDSITEPAKEVPSKCFSLGKILKPAK